MSTSTTQPPDQEPASERNTVLLLAIGGLVAISAVIAGLVIFSSGEAPAEKPEPAASVRAGDQSMLVGKAGAATEVVVYEDFASPASREFEIASRDFLRIEAAQGRVQVEYRPFVSADVAYSREAVAAWLAVLGAGTPKQALAFHNVLFDRQPDPGSTEHDFAAWAKDAGIDDEDVLGSIDAPDEDGTAKADQAAADAGVTSTPAVLVDGDPLTGGTPTQLADKLQRLLLTRKLTSTRCFVAPGGCDMLAPCPTSPDSSPDCPRPSCTSITSARRRHASSPSWRPAIPALCPPTRARSPSSSRSATSRTSSRSTSPWST